EEKRRLLESLGTRPIELNLYNPAQGRRTAAGQDAIITLSPALPPGNRALFPSSWKTLVRERRAVEANLAAAALQDEMPRMIQESFAPIYPDSGDHWVDETTLPAPASYNRSALDAESNVGLVTLSGGTGVVLRFGYFYGPGDMATTMMLDGVRKGRYPLPGRPEGYTTWVHHDDAAAAVGAALQVPSGIYNVVEDQPQRRIELADGLARQLDVKPPKFYPSWVVPLSGSVGQTLARSLRISNKRFKKTAAWTPRYPRMLDGLIAIMNDDREPAAYGSIAP